MRTLDEHKGSPVNDQLEITVLDGPGYSHAHHHYAITAGPYPHDLNNIRKGTILYELKFHQGSQRLDVVSGITDQTLLAIVADRLRDYMSGPHKCRTTAGALVHVEEALNWLTRGTLNAYRTNAFKVNKL